MKRAWSQRGEVATGQKCAVGKDAQFHYWIQNEEGRISSEEEGRRGHKCTRVGKTRAVRHLSSVAPIPSIQMVAPWFLPNLEPLHWIKWSLLSSLILRIWFFISGLARSKTCLFDSFHLWFGTNVNSDIVNTKQLYIKHTLHSLKWWRKWKIWKHLHENLCWYCGLWIVNWHWWWWQKKQKGNNCFRTEMVW